MKMELIKKFAELSAELKESGAISIRMGEIHVRVSALKEFDNLQLTHRHESLYPYEFFTIIEGVKIFGLGTAKDMKEFPQINKQIKEKLKAELQKRLEYLEEDVQLDGMEDEKHETA